MKPVRIKVVFGINDFLIGGMQRQLVEQLKRYDTERFAIEIITLFTFPGQKTLVHEVPEGFPVHSLSFNGWWDLRSWFALYRLLRQIRPDLVVSSLFFSNTLFRLLKPWVGYASVAREHNTYIHKSALEQWIDRVLARLSYTIVAVSRSVAVFTAKQERLEPARFTVIHNGIDVAAVGGRLETLPAAPELQEEMSVHKGERIFLNVSRLMPQKNHQLLLGGFAKFTKTYPQARLFIVGDGPVRQKLEAQAGSLGIAHAVTFFGHRDDVWKFYKIADAYVSTSLMEGLSNAMLEALASGVPLVATSTAGTDELIEEGVNGYGIPEQTPDAVSATLEKFVTHKSSRLAKGARHTAQLFDIRTTVQKYEALFEKSVWYR